MNKKLRNHPSSWKIKQLKFYIRLNKLIFSPHASFWFIAFGFFLISISIVFFFSNEHLSLNGVLKSDKVGQFGDFIGGIVGSVWALSGVILFYVALSLQRKEFALQRQELKETRNVFEQQATQFDKQ